jgi:hypothetical protein
MSVRRHAGSALRLFLLPLRWDDDGLALVQLRLSLVELGEATGHILFE